MKTSSFDPIRLLLGPARLLPGIGCLCLLAAGLAPANAQTVPSRMNYQGQLTDTAGNPLPAGSYQLSFSLWDTATVGSGTRVWGPQVLSGVAVVSDGYFNVILGPNDASSRPLMDAFGATNRYLELTVGAGSPISPRQQILSTPFAMNARSSSVALQLRVPGNTYLGSFATIGGGTNNIAGGQYSTIGGGGNLLAEASYSTIGGGLFNTNRSGASMSTIAGGTGNYIDNSGYAATIGGGYYNSATNVYSTVPGGAFNLAGGILSFAAGHRAKALHTGTFVWGDSQNADFTSASSNQFVVRAQGGVGINKNNPASALDVNGTITATALNMSGTVTATALNVNGTVTATALAGRLLVPGNTASGVSSTISGGANNFAGESYSTIGGGNLNTNGSESIASTIGGGVRNEITNSFATIGGGNLNLAGGTFAAIGGGQLNRAEGGSTAIAGGLGNVATGGGAAVGGGVGNVASALWAFVGGGQTNRASGQWSTASGGFGNIASGNQGTVPGGDSNSAGGIASFAAGRRAKALHTGSFVWGDATAADVSSTADNQFTARASGGVRFFSNNGLTAGVTLAPGGGAWSAVSDRNLKENTQSVDRTAVLEKVAALPMATWNYKSQDAGIRHMGPMAQDFHAAFGLGEDDRHINSIDADGVALAAIQGLHELATRQQKQIESLVTQNSRLADRLAALEGKLATVLARESVPREPGRAGRESINAPVQPGAAVRERSGE